MEKTESMLDEKESKEERYITTIKIAFLSGYEMTPVFYGQTEEHTKTMLDNLASAMKDKKTSCWFGNMLLNPQHICCIWVVSKEKLEDESKD